MEAITGLVVLGILFGIIPVLQVIQERRNARK